MHLGGRLVAGIATVQMLAFAGAAAAGAPATTKPPGILGVWTIVSARRAPWQTAAFPPDAAEMNRLAGARVIFKRDRIIAPSPLGCRKPHYEVRGYTPDMLFQGGLTSPTRQASALGFTGPKIPTLETGCEGALDFHFVDAKTAIFALNNSLYTITRTGR